MLEEISILKKITNNQAKKIKHEYKIKKDIDAVIFPYLKKACKKILQTDIRFICLLNGIEMILSIKTNENDKIKKIKNNIEKICYYIDLSLTELEKLTNK